MGLGSARSAALPALACVLSAWSEGLGFLQLCPQPLLPQESLDVALQLETSSWQRPARCVIPLTCSVARVTFSVHLSRCPVIIYRIHIDFPFLKCCVGISLVLLILVVFCVSLHVLICQQKSVCFVSYHRCL